MKYDWLILMGMMVFILFSAPIIFEKIEAIKSSVLFNGSKRKEIVTQAIIKKKNERTSLEISVLPTFPEDSNSKNDYNITRTRIIVKKPPRKEIKNF